MGNSRKIAVLAPVAWRTPPRKYGAWETVASNIAEGLIERGWDVTLFATGDSLTRGRLAAVVPCGYEEDPTADPKVCECLHISALMEQADEFDLIHNNYDFLPLTYSRLINTPMLTTIHGFSSYEIRQVYRKYKEGYYVSISNADRDEQLNYMATVYNGISLSNITYRPCPGEDLVWLGRIHPDKGVHLAIETALQAGIRLVMAGIIQDQQYFESMVKPFIDGRNVIYAGPVDSKERDELFASAAALLHLNILPERFGLVMAEAMAAGVPVIAMDRGSCREVVQHGRTGFLVHDVGEAVESIAKLGTISRHNCRRHVEKNFTISQMIDGYEALYHEIFHRESQNSKIQSVSEIDV